MSSGISFGDGSGIPSLQAVMRLGDHDAILAAARQIVYAKLPIYANPLTFEVAAEQATTAMSRWFAGEMPRA